MKAERISLVVILLLALALVVSTVIPTRGENNVDNSTQNEQSTPQVQTEPAAAGSPESGTVGQESDDTAVPKSRENQLHEPSKSGACQEESAEAAGWKVLSCDPLRLMSLEEWNTKSASPNFRYRPELYCFDESNFAGIFHAVEPVTFPDPNWLSEVKLENGCSFFFHPNQGQGNGAAKGLESATFRNEKAAR